jgi:acyl-CoA thioester hydrolase
MEGFRHLMSIVVRFRDIDALGHVNNAVYFTYLETARVDYMRRVAFETRPRDFKGVGLILAEISCQFKNPVFYGQSVEVGTRVVEMRNSSFFTRQHIEADGRLAAVAEAVLVHYDYETDKSVRIPDEIRKRIGAFEAES